MLRSQIIDEKTPCDKLEIHVTNKSSETKENKTSIISISLNSYSKEIKFLSSLKSKCLESPNNISKFTYKEIPKEYFTLSANIDSLIYSRKNINHTDLILILTDPYNFDSLDLSSDLVRTYFLSLASNPLNFIFLSLYNVFFIGAMKTYSMFKLLNSVELNKIDRCFIALNPYLMKEAIDNITKKQDDDLLDFVLENISNIIFKDVMNYIWYPIDKNCVHYDIDWSWIVQYPNLHELLITKLDFSDKSFICSGDNSKNIQCSDVVERYCKFISFCGENGIIDDMTIDDPELDSSEKSYDYIDKKTSDYYLSKTNVDENITIKFSYTLVENESKTFEFECGGSVCYIASLISRCESEKKYSKGIFKGFFGRLNKYEDRMGNVINHIGSVMNKDIKLITSLYEEKELIVRNEEMFDLLFFNLIELENKLKMKKSGGNLSFESVMMKFEMVESENLVRKYNKNLIEAYKNSDNFISIFNQ